MAQKQKVKVAVKAVKAVKKVSVKPNVGKSAIAKTHRANMLNAKAAAVAKTTSQSRSKEAAAKKPVKPEVSKKAAMASASKSKLHAAVAKATAAKESAKVAPAKKAATAKPVAPAVKPAVASKPAAARPTAAAAPAQRTVPAAIGKPSAQKISAPVPAVAAAVVAPVMTPKALAEKAAAARGQMAAQKKPVSARHGFKTNEFVVYPAHGVGRIVGIEEQEIAGMSLELFVITFDKEKLTLRVPTGKLASIGMRKLAEESVVKRAMETLKGRARVKRTMWSRRAQEYVAKINSGDLISIAEVVRDLYRSEAQPEQSYSERQLYENALERMARELAAVERLDERGAVQRIVEILSKSAKGRRMAAEGIEAVETDIKAA